MLLKPLDRSQLVASSIHRAALEYLKMSACKDETMHSFLDVARNGRYVKQRPDSFASSACTTFSKHDKVETLLRKKRRAIMRMNRQTTEADNRVIEGLLLVKSSNIDVYPTMGGWRVEKDGISLVGQNDRRTRVWKDLNRCVRTLREWGARRITVHADQLEVAQ